MAFSADDRAAIVELSARYIHTFDRRDYDAWVRCFSEDGVLEEAVRTVGRDELRKLAADPAATPVRHTPATLWVQGEGESATMRSYYTVMRLSDPPETIEVGRWEDGFKKIDGEWKIAQRRVVTDWKKED